MYEGWEDLPDEVIMQNKRDICSKCEYFSVYTASSQTVWVSSTCEYIDVHKHSRGCLPTECVEKGIFKPRTKKRKRKQVRISY